jgi:hypothetical protein
MRKLNQLAQLCRCIAPPALALAALLAVGAGPATAQVSGCGGPQTGTCRTTYRAPRQMTFGQASWLDHALCGLIYYLAPNTSRLPDLSFMRPVGAIYARNLNVPRREWQEGFPGVSRRFEWFAIEYHGIIRAGIKGNYSLRLVSDDGSKLFIDDRPIINNDGMHEAQSAAGSVYLDSGPHTIRIQYFQGPRFYVALQLYCTRQGEEERLFPDCGIDVETPDVRSSIRYDPFEDVNSSIRYADTRSTVRYNLAGSPAPAGSAYPSDCRPSDVSNRCTPMRPVVTPKGWGAYHVLLPGPLVVGIPNPDNLRLAVSNSVGDVCWDSALGRSALAQKFEWERVGCDGPAGSAQVETAGAGFLMPRKRPGALLVWTSGGITYFAVNGRIANHSLNANQLSEFQNQEGSLEFDVQAEPPDMLGSRTATPRKAPDDFAAIPVAGSLAAIDPAKETWQILGASADPRQFDEFARVFSTSEFASQAVAKAAQLRSGATTARSFNTSTYDVPYPPASNASPGGSPAPAAPTQFDAYGQAVKQAAAPPARPGVPTATLYLIAMRNRTLVGATAYWVAQGILHYVTADRVEHRIALNQVNRDLTLRLNRQRGVSIQLPRE